jgi:hypothetical protein
MKIVMKTILVILILFSSLDVMSKNIFPIQLQAPANPGNDPGNGVPVDGGITALLIGGVVYGAKKLKEMKNPK